MIKAILYFNDIRLNPSQIHKLRGYVGMVFAEHDLIHNHNPQTGNFFYRYPLIQFKLINNIPCIVALTEKAVHLFTQIFMGLNEINIEGRQIPINEKDLKIETTEFGYTSETYVYEFISPWIALNQSNFAKFVKMSNKKDKQDLLKRTLTGNILSMAKYMDCRLTAEERIHSDLQVHQTSVNLKGKNMLGFKGMFKTNFMLPDHAGLGKSVSRGFGTIEKRL